MSLEDRTP